MRMNLPKKELGEERDEPNLSVKGKSERASQHGTENVKKYS